MDDFTTTEFKAMFLVIKEGADKGVTTASGMVELAEDEQVLANNFSLDNSY